MNNKDFAKKLNISEPTLYNWKKEKPFLYQIVMQYKEKYLKNNNNLNNFSKKEKEFLEYFNKLNDNEKEYYIADIKARKLKKEIE